MTSILRIAGAANDTAPARAPHAGGPQRYTPLPPLSLTSEQLAVFKALNPAALWIAGNLDGPQPTRFGDNAGAWPITMGVTQDRRHKKLPDPFFARGTLLRYWCEVTAGDALKSWDTAERLHVAVYKALEPYFGLALHEFLALDGAIRLGHVDRAVRDEAARLKIEIMTDRELAAHAALIVRAGMR